MDLYHYTDKAGAQGIQKSGQINANKGIAGTGVYFTSKNPETRKSELVKNNYDDGRRLMEQKKGKVDYYFDFKSHDLKGLKSAKQPGRDIYMVPKDVKVPSHKVAKRC